jgi:hypothetical protein
MRAAATSRIPPFRYSIRTSRVVLALPNSDTSDLQIDHLVVDCEQRWRHQPFMNSRPFDHSLALSMFLKASAATVPLIGTCSQGGVQAFSINRALPVRDDDDRKRIPEDIDRNEG